MEAKRQKMAGYCIGGILLLVGIVCYAAFPPRTPDKPVRIVLQSTAGNVIFDHKIHESPDDYGIDCVDCHHTWEDPETKPELCSSCHGLEAEEGLPKISDAFHKQCIGCHDEGGVGPVQCFECHVL